jgi:hypothetical protein
MFHVPLEGALRAVDALKANLLFNRSVRDFVAAGGDLPDQFRKNPPLDEWKRLDYSTTVTRLYQIYESLVHDSIAEWLEDLCQMVPYGELPEEVKSAHRNGIGFILQNIDGRRFENLSLSTIVRDYEVSLSERSPYNLLSDAFLLHNRNLRLEELTTIFRGCGLKINLNDWLQVNRLSKSESLQLIGHQTVEKCLSTFIDLRNEASHATKKVSDMVGEDVLFAYADFIRGFCEALIEAMSFASLVWHEKHGHWSKVGQITWIKKDERQICVAVVESCKLKVSGEIYLTGNGYCCLTKVNEIQIDGVAASVHIIGVAPQEIGLNLSIETFKGARIYVRIDSPPEVAERVLYPETIEIGVDEAFETDESAMEEDEEAT